MLDNLFKILYLHCRRFLVSYNVSRQTLVNGYTSKHYPHSYPAFHYKFTYLVPLREIKTCNLK